MLALTNNDQTFFHTSYPILVALLHSYPFHTFSLATCIDNSNGSQTSSVRQVPTQTWCPWWPCSLPIPNVLRPTYTIVRKFEDQFCMTSGPWFLISGLWHLEKSLVTSLPFSDLSSLIVFINSRTINSLDRSSNKKWRLWKVEDQMKNRNMYVYT